MTKHVVGPGWMHLRAMRISIAALFFSSNFNPAALVFNTSSCFISPPGPNRDDVVGFLLPNGSPMLAYGRDCLLQIWAQYYQNHAKF